MYRRILSTVIIASCVAFAQVKSSLHQVVELPNGPVTRIISPDKRWTMIFECPNNCQERNLWIEDGLHARRLVGKYNRSLAVAWVPDSRRFFVNDDFGSNGSESYVIDPTTLQAVDISKIITKHEAQAKQLLSAGHSYLRAKRWVNDHTLIVVLVGHFDETPPRGFTPAFTFEYRVDLEGGTARILHHSKEEPQ